MMLYFHPWNKYSCGNAATVIHCCSNVLRSQKSAVWLRNIYFFTGNSSW